VVSKCANPDCGVSFHSLRDGRVLAREVEVDPHPDPDGMQRSRVVRYVWLCSSCCRKLTVEVRDGKINLTARAPSCSPDPDSDRNKARAS